MNYQKLVFFTLRFVVYAAIMIGLYAIFQHDAVHNSGDVKITENSLTEIFQEVFVFLTAAGFFIAGRKSKELGPVLNLMSLF